MEKRWICLGFLAALVLYYMPSSAVPADGSAEITEEPRYIAITFDDGPKPGTTDVLLDGLKERGAAATFFLVGAEAQKHPELVRRMQAEGHQVGNHTWSHVRLEDAPETTVREEVGRMEALLEDILGGRDYWLRPPYGQLSPETEGLISVPMAKWSVDPRDWESRNADKVTAAVLEAAKPNSIILLHDIYPSSVEAALRLVDVLQAEGYWFVTVDELLRLNGVKPQAGVLYRTGKG